MTEQLKKLSDVASEAHRRIQIDFEQLNPVIGVSQKMRDIGIPADAMMIDCLKTKKRIVIVLSDQEPDVVRFQFSYIDKDPSDTFEKCSLSGLTPDLMYQWMKTYFL